MAAASLAYRAVRPDVVLEWTTRPLAMFNDQPVWQVAGGYDLIFVDHPMSGAIAARDALVPLDSVLDAGELAQIASKSVSNDAYVCAIEPASTIPGQGVAAARRKRVSLVRLVGGQTREVTVEAVLFRAAGRVRRIGPHTVSWKRKELRHDGAVQRQGRGGHRRGGGNGRRRGAAAGRGGREGRRVR